MALFSFNGKRDQQPDTPRLPNAVLPEEMKQSSSAEKNVATQQEAEQVRARRDIARQTAEKIDAIESEFARDILRAPPVVAEDDNVHENRQPEQTAPSTNPFQPTILALSSEQRTLLLDDKDT